MDCFVAVAPLRKRFAFVAGNDDREATASLKGESCRPAPFHVKQIFNVLAFPLGLCRRVVGWVERSDTHQPSRRGIDGYRFAPPIPRTTILNLMADDDLTDEISRIEAQLEDLAEVAERCRKFILASKAAIAGGVVLLLVVMLGLFGSHVAALGSIAMVLGGIVLLGSNVSTLRQTEAAIGAAEALRSDLISRIDLRVVADAPAKLA
jgi:hypothetical protein